RPGGTGSPEKSGTPGDAARCTVHRPSTGSGCCLAVNQAKPRTPAMLDRRKTAIPAPAPTSVAICIEIAANVVMKIQQKIFPAIGPCPYPRIVHLQGW